MPDASSEAVAAPPAPAPKLDDLMLAMDVVDTLRHQDRLVARELDQDSRDATLKARLREIYESQGLEVSDRILDQGIVALRESRFAYTPAPPGLSRVLAGLWIRRSKVAAALATVIVVVALVVGWQSWRRGAAEQARETARIELTETLPQALSAAGAAATAVAATEDAQARIDNLVAQGRAAAIAADANGMRTAIAELEALRDQLERTYQLRIVARPGEDTGVFRIPDVNQSARNYYVIVEAVTDDGDVLSVPVVNEETGAGETVTKWGVRVPQATFDRVRSDKEDDGIVQNDILGEKPRGALAVDYLMPVEDGAITQW